MFSRSAISDVLRTPFGRSGAARLVLLVLVAQGALLLGAKAWMPGPRARRIVRVLAVPVLLGTMATLATAGHANSGKHRMLALPVDVVHLGAVSLWLGGLALLCAVLLRRRRFKVAATVVPKFSTVAFACVAVAVATGTVQGWRQLDGLESLRETSFGRLLIVKLAVFAVLIAVAWRSRATLRRRFLPADTGQVDSDAARQLRRSVLAEAVLAAGVLGVTAALVTAVPARTAIAQPSGPALPVSLQLAGDEAAYSLEVDPARRGLNDIHVYVTDEEGRSREVLELAIELTPPTEGAPALDLPLVKTGVGHYSAFGVDLPLAGTWSLELVTLLTEFDQERVESTFEIP
jgi:copper transport protein